MEQSSHIGTTAMISEITRLLNSHPRKILGEALGLTGLCTAIIAALYLPAFV